MSDFVNSERRCLSIFTAFIDVIELVDVIELISSILGTVRGGAEVRILSGF